MGGSRGGDRGSGPRLKNHKNIGFLSNFGPDPLKNYEATEPAFNVGPSSARQGNAIKMAFCWRADDGPLIVVFGSTHLSPTKKNTPPSPPPPPPKKKSKFDPLWQNFLDLRMILFIEACVSFVFLSFLILFSSAVLLWRSTMLKLWRKILKN